MTSKKRILVIDDESSVRETICENLKECGYTVLEAGDGDSGLKNRAARGSALNCRYRVLASHFFSFPDIDV